MKPNIDIPGLAKFIAKEMFVFNKTDSFDDLKKLGAFNNYDISKLEKEIIIELRKYKLIKLNETEY